MILEKELGVALDAVQKAVRLCASVQHQLVSADTLQKKDRSPVTIADFGSQAVISSVLAASFPDDPLVGEEDIEGLKSNPAMMDRVLTLVQNELPGMTEPDLLSAVGRGNAEPSARGRFWTVDPIDGTKGFLRHEQYAVALALIEDGRPRLGVLGCPNLPADFDDPQAEIGFLFYAVEGEQAFRCRLDGSGAQSIRVNQPDDPKRLRFAESVESGHADHSTHVRISAALGISAEPLRIDSQCKYGALARGDVAVYLRYPTDDRYREKIWDHAAGVVVIEQAGGRASDIYGRPLDFGQGRTLAANRGVVATNGALHDALIRAIESL